MAARGIELTGDVPDGWVSVEPEVVNEDAASIVLLRRADLDAPFTTNITVTEQLMGPTGDLAERAAAYRQRLAGRTTDLTLVREGMISESSPDQYAQELQFTVNLDGRSVDIKQSQFLLEIPTEEPSKLVLLQLLYSAPAESYESGQSAVVQFMESIQARRQPGETGDAPPGPAERPGLGKAHLESRVKELLERSAGKKADAVICNGDLPAEIGAVQRCALVVGETKLGVTVTVTGVENADVKFDIQVDRKPMV
ncbi:DUF4333 domain-containing protein [Mycolicibacterium sp. XJ775]